MTKKDEALELVGRIIWEAAEDESFNDEDKGMMRSLSAKKIDELEEDLGYKVGIDITNMGKWSEILVSASGIKVCSLIIAKYDYKPAEVYESYYYLRTLSQKEIARTIQISRPSCQECECTPYA